MNRRQAKRLYPLVEGLIRHGTMSADMKVEIALSKEDPRLGHVILITWPNGDVAEVKSLAEYEANLSQLQRRCQEMREQERTEVENSLRRRFSPEQIREMGIALTT